MKIELKNILFFFITSSLIFSRISENVSLKLISGSLYQQLLFYPVAVLFIYFGYKLYKDRSEIKNGVLFLKFILVATVISIIELILGIYTYPYYPEILSKPEQLERLQQLFLLYPELGMGEAQALLVRLFLFLRPIKILLLEILYTYGLAYIIYAVYSRSANRIYTVMNRAILFSVCIVLAYSSVEIAWFAGSDMAENILITMNPYIHAVKENGLWWPPLLWENQLRSVFAEPSYFGMYAAFAVPFLWYQIVQTKGKKKIALLVIMGAFLYCLFLTKARTAVGLFIGEILLFAIFSCYLRKGEFVKNFLVIAICSLLAFIGATGFLTFKENVSGKHISHTQSIQAYFGANVASVASTNQRSNGARYAIMGANFKIGLAHPLFGVGFTLRDAYIRDYLSESGKSDAEVQMWIKNQKEKGILKSGFPNLGEYTTRFAETGLVGLILFLVPPLVLLKRLLCLINEKRKDITDVSPYVFFCISFLGVLASGIGDSLNLIYSYWILLGLGYAMCWRTRDNYEK